MLVVGVDMTFAKSAAGVAAALFLAALAPAPAAWAADPFEIQVYDATADAPGVVGLELHVNGVPSGLKQATPPELPLDKQAHFTLEPSIGVTSFLELGAYLQTTLRPDGVFDYSGIKLRSKFVTPPDTWAHLRLGVNLELSRLPERYDRNRWGGEVRPIVAWENDRFLFAANPIVGITFTSGSGGPTFEPAAMAKVKLGSRVAVGVEYYGDLGAIGSPDPLAAQQHSVFETLDLIGYPPLELNVGVGEGLTSASNNFVVKAIVGWSFEALTVRARPVDIARE